MIAKTAILAVPLALALASGGALAQQQQGAEAAGPTAHANLINQEGQRVGAITLSEYPAGVFIHGYVEGLTPGWRAIHIHETGACEPDFSAAGGHYNPAGVGHGLDGEAMHAGDLPNIHIPDGGLARFEMITKGVTLTAGATTVFDQDGSAFVVHAGPDDYVTDPAGNSGARVACGVIQSGAQAAAAPDQTPDQTLDQGGGGAVSGGSGESR